MISPSSSFCDVRALNCLQNSMILTCACPSAGPTGGAGVALPAAIWSFTDPVAFFAMMPFRLHSCCLSHLLHLPKLQLHRSRAPEDRDHNLQSLAILVDFIHNARKRSERPFTDPHRLVLLELDLKLGLLAAVSDLVNDVADFLFRKRSRLLSRADKSRDARRRFHDVPDVIVHVHF